MESMPHAANFSFLKSTKDFLTALPRVPESTHTSAGDLESGGDFQDPEETSQLSVPYDLTPPPSSAFFNTLTLRSGHESGRMKSRCDGGLVETAQMARGGCLDLVHYLSQ